MYLSLQPYKQTSLKRNGAKKLKPRYYGSYKVIWKIGEVSYELELPKGSKIHNVFHVSCLKKDIGQQTFISDRLPPLDDEGQLTLILEKVLKTRERRLRSRTIKEYFMMVEGSTKWRFHMGRGEYFAASKSEISWGQARLGREDCNVPIQIIA